MDSLSRAEAIVILAGVKYANAPEYDGDTVNTTTLERIRYGIHLQKKTQLPILVTGGAPFGGSPEAEIMAATIHEDFRASVRWIENSAGTDRIQCGTKNFTGAIPAPGQCSVRKFESYSGVVRRFYPIFCFRTAAPSRPKLNDTSWQ